MKEYFELNLNEQIIDFCFDYNFIKIRKIKLKNKYKIPLISMSYMFYNCSSLDSLNLSNFNTPNVTDMSYMFYNCSSLDSLNYLILILLKLLI